VNYGETFSRAVNKLRATQGPKFVELKAVGGEMAQRRSSSFDKSKLLIPRTCGSGLVVNK